MNLQILNDQIKKGESDVLEFKKTTGQLHAAMQTVSAFLNSWGGTVLIGISNEGKILGQAITDHTRQEIAKEIHKIEPAVSLKIQYIPIQENKSIIVINVPHGQHVPYTYDGRAFQRVESTTSRMSQHHYEQLLALRKSLHQDWDSVTTDECTLNDLDQELIYKTVSDGIRENRIPASAQTENTAQILERLNLIRHSKITRAAMVLYSRKESLQFLQCMIKMARFQGINKLGNFIDNQQIYGNAFELLSAASENLTYLKSIGLIEVIGHAKTARWRYLKN